MSKLETELLFQIQALKLPEPVREHRIHPPRRWRCDFCWPDHMLAVECDGAIFSGGRHTRGKGFEADCQKLNRAILDSWKVLRFTSGMIRRGEALQALEQAWKDCPQNQPT
jgi:very-short-patch-repair endonuclease